MECKTFEHRMQLLLDERQEPNADDALQRHAAECPPCQSRLEAQAKLFAGLSLLGASDSACATQAIVPASSARGTFRYRSVFGMAAIVAAVTLLVVWRDAPRQGGEYATPPEQERFVQQSPLPPLEEPAQAPAIIAAPQFLQLDALAANLSPASLPNATLQRMEQAGLARGLRPLASSFQTAFGVLRKTIPVGRERQDPPQAGLQVTLDGPVA